MALHPASALTFQELLLRLQTFWAGRGCIIEQPYDLEVGAGTMAPETFLRVLDSQPFSVAYAQPSRRPADGRYGENPNRLFKHTQFQVILKPPPVDVLEMYLESLTAIGIDLRQHDLKFEEDNWEAPTLGAWGIGWQVMLDGLEVTQFTYFQQCGGIDLDPICAEITYGLERIAAFLQDVDSVYDIVWTRGPSHSRRRRAPPGEQPPRHLWPGPASRGSRSSPLTTLSMPMWKSFGSISASTRRSAGSSSPAPGTRQVSRRLPILPAYDLCLKCSHLFNLLDARGAISVTERVGVIARIRLLAVGVANLYVRMEPA